MYNVLLNSFLIQFCFTWYEYSYSSLFWLPFAWYILFQLFTFSICISLQVKSISVGSKQLRLFFHFSFTSERASLDTMFLVGAFLYRDFGYIIPLSTARILMRNLLGYILHNLIFSLTFFRILSLSLPSFF